jgi:hypothetical protein
MGGADSAIPDSSNPCFNPFGAPSYFVEHAFQWQADVLTDLEALDMFPAANFGRAFWIDAGGLVV